MYLGETRTLTEGSMTVITEQEFEQEWSFLRKINGYYLWNFIIFSRKQLRVSISLAILKKRGGGGKTKLVESNHRD